MSRYSKCNILIARFPAAIRSGERSPNPILPSALAITLAASLASMMLAEVPSLRILSSLHVPRPGIDSNLALWSSPVEPELVASYLSRTFTYNLFAMPRGSEMSQSLTK